MNVVQLQCVILYLTGTTSYDEGTCIACNGPFCFYGFVPQIPMNPERNAPVRHMHIARHNVVGILHIYHSDIIE